MAISSIGSAFGSGASTAAVDVADIVSRLMSAENRLLNAINLLINHCVDLFKNQSIQPGIQKIQVWHPQL